MNGCSLSLPYSCWLVALRNGFGIDFQGWSGCIGCSELMNLFWKYLLGCTLSTEGDSYTPDQQQQQSLQERAFCFIRMTPNSMRQKVQSAKLGTKPWSPSPKLTGLPTNPPRQRWAAQRATPQGCLHEYHRYPSANPATQCHCEVTLPAPSFQVTPAVSILFCTHNLNKALGVVSLYMDSTIPSLWSYSAGPMIYTHGHMESRVSL